MIREGSGRAFWVRFRDFLGRKIWQYFLVGLIQEGILFGQIQINLRIRGRSAYASRVALRIKYKTKLVSAVQCFAALLIFNTFCKFLRLGNSAWDFFGWG